MGSATGTLPGSRPSDPPLHAQNRGFAWQPRRGPFRRVTPEQARAWDERGFFLLERAFSPETCRELIAAIDPFEAVGVIITLILLGRLIEARAKAGTGEAIRQLIGLQAKTARVIRDGTEAEIPVTDVAVGDIVVVRPGEKIPVDGEVTDGTSAVDESSSSRTYRATPRSVSWTSTRMRARTSATSASGTCAAWTIRRPTSRRRSPDAERTSASTA